MMNRYAAAWIVLMGAAFFGSLSTLVKLGYQDGFTTGELTGSQYIIGTGGLWLLTLLFQRKKVPWKAAGKLLASGIFPGLVAVFYYWSLQSINASLAIVLLFQFTWMGIVLDFILHKHRPGRSQWGALLLILVGTILAAGVISFTTGSIHLTGVLFGLLAAVSYTGFIHVSGNTANQVPSLQRSGWMMTGATITVSVVFPPQFLIEGTLWEGLWIWGTALGVLGVILPPLLFTKGVPHIGAGMATILGSVELPVVLLLSFFILNEKITPLQWSGTLLILLGIILSEGRWLDRRKK